MEPALASPAQISEMNSHHTSLEPATLTNNQNGSASSYPERRRYHNAVQFSGASLEGKETPTTLETGSISLVFYSSATLLEDSSIELKRMHANNGQVANGMSEGIKTCTALRSQNKDLKIVLSIGNDTTEWSEILCKTAFDSKRREKFAYSAKKVIDAEGLDGLDISWGNGNDASEANNLLLLLARLRDALPRADYSLTMSLPFSRSLDLEKAAVYLDLLNLKCFNFTAATSMDKVSHDTQIWSTLGPGDTSGLSCATLVSDFVQRGVPPHKIMLAIPAFGRAYPGASQLGEHYDHRHHQSSIVPYSQFAHRVSYIKYDNYAGACTTTYLKEYGLLSFDNPWTVALKAELVKENGLAGIVTWEAWFDSEEDSTSIVAAGFCQLSSNR